MAVAVETEPRLSIGIPAVVVEGDYVSGDGSKNWDVAPDGRFLMMQQLPSDLSINIVLNWHQELLERVPVP